MTPEAARAYVRNWVETGRVLEDIRWRELSGMDDATALRARDRSPVSEKGAYVSLGRPFIRTIGTDYRRPPRLEPFDGTS
jgi:hypothetical protein